MSPSVYVTRRERKAGARFVVRYRLGGRGFPLIHAGSFRTLKEARARRDYIAGEIAAGRNPAASLRELTSAPPAARTYAQVAADYETSRIDYADSSRTAIAGQVRKLVGIFGDRDPATLTVPEQIQAVARLAQDLQPSTLAKYWFTHRRILDFAGVDPNPARDRAVKLPRIVATEVSPPTAAHVLAVLDRVPHRWRLPLVTIEQTAMAIGETSTLAWGDVDIPGRQFRLRRDTVKGGIRARARWVQVPDWLMDALADSCPPDDRATDRRVFPGLSQNTLYLAMSRACRAAGIPVYSPHDLRHRRLSLWHGQGVPAKQLAERAGHTRASMSLDIYSHVMALDEAPTEVLQRMLMRR